MRVPLTPPTGRTAPIKRWWCGRFGHVERTVLVAGWVQPDPRSPRQRISDVGVMCTRCRVWTWEPELPVTEGSHIHLEGITIDTPE